MSATQNGPTMDNEKLFDAAETLHMNGIGFQPLRSENGNRLEFVLAYIPTDCDIDRLGLESKCSTLRSYDFIGRDFLLIDKSEYQRRFIVLEALANLGIPSTVWFLHAQISVSDVQRPITQQAVEECVYSMITTGSPAHAAERDSRLARFTRAYYAGRVDAVSHLLQPFVYRHWDQFTIPKKDPSKDETEKHAHTNFLHFQSYIAVADFFETLASS